MVYRLQGACKLSVLGTVEFERDARNMDSVYSVQSTYSITQTGGSLPATGTQKLAHENWRALPIS
jgi:hypothetical protein